jgi:1,4-dihydroxy-2-naphthoate octaprenyltransferase
MKLGVLNHEGHGWVGMGALISFICCMGYQIVFFIAYWERERKIWRFIIESSLLVYSAWACGAVITA